MSTINERLEAAVAAHEAAVARMQTLLDALADFDARFAPLEARVGGSGALPYWFLADEIGQAAQTIPSGAATKNTSMIQKDGNVAAGAFAAGRFTVTEATKGAWLFYARLNILNEVAEFIELRRNGVAWTNVQLSSVTGSANLIAPTVPVPLGTAGDYVEFFHKHEAGANRTTENSQIIGIRVS